MADAAHSPDEAFYDRLGASHDRALVRLLRTPAPGAADLAVKFELAIAQLARELTAGEAYMAALLADARRFARSIQQRRGYCAASAIKSM